MKMLETSIAPLDPIEGSADLELMTITVNFEGGYGQLLRLGEFHRPVRAAVYH